MANDKILDYSALLSEVSAEEVCGQNLEYDATFLELERVAKGKPEVQYGKTITPAEPPDWKQVRALCLQLLENSRDLRVAVFLTRALLALQGIRGFAAGIHLIELFLAERWDCVHPQLDPDDDNDPTVRINTLSALCEASTVLKDLRSAWLITSRAQGRFSLRDIEIATGESEAPAGETPVALSLIVGAFTEADPEEIQDTFAALERAFTSTARIDSILSDRVGASQSLDLRDLSKMLKRARNFFLARMEQGSDHADLTDNVGDVGVSTDNDSTAQLGGNPRPRAAAKAISGEIGSREDAIRMLDKICAYYTEHEPASPVPLLLLRAQRLAKMNFLELMRDMAPDSLSQIYAISGNPEQS